MITALPNNIAPEFYTPIKERDEDSPTRFKLKPLDGIEYLSVINESQIIGGDIKLSPSASSRVLKAGIADWENFNDSNGKAIKFSVHNFKRIPVEILAELASEIITISSVDEEDEKN